MRRRPTSLSSDRGPPGADTPALLPSGALSPLTPVLLVGWLSTAASGSVCMAIDGCGRVTAAVEAAAAAADPAWLVNGRYGLIQATCAHAVAA
eukprot:COSAG01_NODE_4557_length_4924_cov_25.696580_2_plen_93_part_00